MGLRETIQRRRTDILQLAAHYGARNVRLFGSVARGTERSGSDVDFLVDMQDGRSLLHLIGFSDALEEVLHVKVDVLTEYGISPHMRDRITSEAVAL